MEGITVSRSGARGGESFEGSKIGSMDPMLALTIDEMVGKCLRCSIRAGLFRHLCESR